jgi:thioredoxin reductase (NADPH)
MENYDFIVVGAGGSGLAGGMYAARLGLKTLILGKTSGSELPVGGVITTTDMVENYPGFKSISGFELAKNLENHARAYDLVSIKNEEIFEVKKDKNCFLIKTKKSEYKGKAILFATGTKWKKLDVKGSKEFDYKGINYCALCDAPLYKNKICCRGK